MLGLTHPEVGRGYCPEDPGLRREASLGCLPGVWLLYIPLHAELAPQPKVILYIRLACSILLTSYLRSEREAFLW